MLKSKPNFTPNRTRSSKFSIKPIAVISGVKRGAKNKPPEVNKHVNSKLSKTEKTSHAQLET